MPSGPQSGSASTNYPRGIENGVDWCTAFLEHVKAKGYTRVEATEAAEERDGQIMSLRCIRRC